MKVKTLHERVLFGVGHKPVLISAVIGRPPTGGLLRYRSFLRDALAPAGFVQRHTYAVYLVHLTLRRVVQDHHIFSR